jgi:hypothetical protein
MTYPLENKLQSLLGLELCSRVASPATLIKPQGRVTCLGAWQIDILTKYIPKLLTSLRTIASLTVELTTSA